MSKGSTPFYARRRPDRAALCIAASLVVIAGIIFWDVSKLPNIGGYSKIGPATVPHAIAWCLIGLAAWTTIAAFRHDFPKREKQELGPVFWIVAGLVLQMLFLNVLGFSIATGILFAFTARGFGKRQIWYSLPIGIVLSFAVWTIFSKLLKLSLPAGPFERLFF